MLLHRLTLFSMVTNSEKMFNIFFTTPFHNLIGLINYHAVTLFIISSVNSSHESTLII